MNLITLLDEEVGEVGSVLAGDSSHECLLHALPDCAEFE
jgi:hypothetical protein